MTRFRPCIDLHSGQVKQIVGGTLKESPEVLQTNHVSKLPASHFAQLYKDRALAGAHVIMLGPGNEDAAEKALKTWPDSLQVGGGINDQNAMHWILKGAEKVIFPVLLERSILRSLKIGRTFFAIVTHERSSSCLPAGDRDVVSFSERTIFSRSFEGSIECFGRRQE